MLVGDFGRTTYSLAKQLVKLRASSTRSLTAMTTLEYAYVMYS